MSSDEEIDFRDDEFDEEGSVTSEESGEESHEVREELRKKLICRKHDIPLDASVDLSVVRAVSYFENNDFMPPGTTFEIEEVPNEDDDDLERHVYASWKCENYRVEVYVDHEDDSYFRVRLVHLNRKIVNSGHVYSTSDVRQICDFLNQDEVSSAVRLLFQRYGGGMKDGDLRSEENLDQVVLESEFRNTNSGLEP